MNSIEEKNCLTQDLEKARKIIEELQMEKVRDLMTGAHSRKIEVLFYSPVLYFRMN